LSDFPPSTIEAFLSSCAGEWIALRSQFAPITPSQENESSQEGEAWHDSERGEIKVDYLSPATSEAPGGLRVTAPGGNVTTLTFLADGQAVIVASSQVTASGTWHFWPDGILELDCPAEDGKVRERIWFAKPNLRLRSSLAHRADGEPGRASFSTEIRRVSRPPAEVP
jgi:hypothetical protein